MDVASRTKTITEATSWFAPVPEKLMRFLSRMQSEPQIQFEVCLFGSASIHAGADAYYKY